MEDDGLHFKSELVRWKRYWEKEMANRKEKSAEMEEKRRQENQRKALLYMHDKRRRNPEPILKTVGLVGLEFVFD